MLHVISVQKSSREEEKKAKRNRKGKKKKTVVEAFSPSLGIVAFWSVQYPKRDRERKKAREKLKEKKEEKKNMQQNWEGEKSRAWSQVRSKESFLENSSFSHLLRCGYFIYYFWSSPRPWARSICFFSLSLHRISIARKTRKGSIVKYYTPDRAFRSSRVFAVHLIRRSMRAVCGYKTWICLIKRYMHIKAIYYLSEEMWQLSV